MSKNNPSPPIPPASSMKTPRPSKSSSPHDSHFKDINAELERWDSLLQEEGPVKWESFSKSGGGGGGPGGGNDHQRNVDRSVRFEYNGGGGTSEEEDIDDVNNTGNLSYVEQNNNSMTINEQLQNTMEQLIEKNIQLTEEMDVYRSRSLRELSSMEELAVKEKVS